MPVAIVSDTCHYLRSDLVTANGIQLVSLYVHQHGQTQRESEIAGTGLCAVIAQWDVADG